MDYPCGCGTYYDQIATVENVDDNTKDLVLKHRSSPLAETRFTIDVVRNVVLKIVTSNAGVLGRT